LVFLRGFFTRTRHRFFVKKSNPQKNKVSNGKKTGESDMQGRALELEIEGVTKGCELFRYPLSSAPLPPNTFHNARR